GQCRALVLAEERAVERRREPDEVLLEEAAALPLELEAREDALERRARDALRPGEDPEPLELVPVATVERVAQVAERDLVGTTAAQLRLVLPVLPSLLLVGGREVGLPASTATRRPLLEDPDVPLLATSTCRAQHPQDSLESSLRTSRPPIRSSCRWRE